MTKSIVTTRETQSLLDAIQIMQKNNFHRMPIVNNEEKLIGIVTDKDIFKIIINNNKDLISNIGNNKDFQSSQSIIEKYKEHLLKIFFNWK